MEEKRRFLSLITCFFFMCRSYAGCSFAGSKIFCLLFCLLFFSPTNSNLFSGVCDKGCYPPLPQGLTPIPCNMAFSIELRDGRSTCSRSSWRTSVYSGRSRTAHCFCWDRILFFLIFHFSARSRGSTGREKKLSRLDSLGVLALSPPIVTREGGQIVVAVVLLCLLASVAS